MYVFTLQNVPGAGCGVTYWRWPANFTFCPMRLSQQECVTEHKCVFLHWAFNLTISCSSLLVILSEVYRHIGGNYLGSASFSDRVPRLTRTASTLTAATGHFISGLTLHTKYTRSVEKFTSLHPVTFHRSPFVSSV